VRLTKPTRVVETPPPDPTPPEEPAVELCTGGTMAGDASTQRTVALSVAEDKLRKLLPIGRRPRGCVVHRRCFSGADTVSSMMRHFRLPREEAMQQGVRFHGAGLLAAVAGGGGAFADSSALYRLRMHFEPLLLNGRQPWRATELSQPPLTVVHAPTSPRVAWPCFPWPFSSCGLLVWRRGS
jgi:hypothetical protein